MHQRQILVLHSLFLDLQLAFQSGKFGILQLSRLLVIAFPLGNLDLNLVDEACALIKTELDSMPTELDELNRRVMQMEIEEAALKKEDDSLSRERLANLQRERPVGLPCPDDRVQLVDKQDNLTVGFFHILQHRLQPFLG